MLLTTYQLWIQDLLLTRNLQKPDGRPLYAYRLTDTEFDCLKQLLTRKDHRDIQTMGEENHFLTCWFLYAAEWWKRCYSGGAWSWTPIFQAINFDDLESLKRTEWVEAASNFWRLKDETLGGKRFLGKVVVNGGLPLKLIKEADGKLYGILHATLGEALRSTSPLSSVQLLTQIELQSSYLPKSYRQATVYGLLAQVINTVLALKNSIPANSEVDPVSQLDRQNPEWLTQFPLQIDSDSARQLLVKLIRQAVANPKQTKQQFTVARHIRFNDDATEWEFECGIEASPRFSAQTLGAMLKRDELDLPVTIDLVIKGERSAITVGQLQRRDSDYMIKLTHPTLPDTFFHQSLRLEASRFGQLLGSIELESSEAPDPEVPWVFEDNETYPRLIWAGSRRLVNSSCYLLIPETASLKEGNDNICVITIYRHRSLIKIKEGKAQIECNNELYEVICGSNTYQTSDSIIWGSNRVFIESSPSYIFLGKPRLELIDSEGIRKLVPSNELFWRTRQHESSIDQIRSFGVGTIYWRQHGKVMLRQRAVCLPSSRNSNSSVITPPIDIKFQDHGKTSGQIRLNGWPAALITCSTEDVHIQCDQVDNGWIVDVTSDIAPPPLTIDLHLTWKDGQNQVISMPFPVEGAFIVNDSNQPIDQKGIISLHELNFLHVNLRAKSTRNWQIRLQLIGAKAFSHTPMQLIRCRKTPENTSMVRLYDLREQVRRLLSLCDDLDARVQISFEYGEISKASLHVARYSHLLDKEMGKGWVTIDNASTKVVTTEILEKISLRTVPLLECDQAPRGLSKITSEGTHTGNWAFEPELKQPGLWLIYPSEESSIYPRALLWFVPERYAKPAPILYGLRKAMSLTNRDDRLNAIETVFKLIAEDASSKDWNFVQSLIEKFSHLPLPSLDIWVSIVRVPKAVVCAYLKLEGFIEKIAPRLSEELPFDWLLTSPQDWLDNIRTLSQSISDDELALRVMKHDLEYRLQWIFERQSGLDISVRFARASGLGLTEDDDIQFLIAHPETLASIWLDNLLYSENNTASEFVRRATQNSSVDLPAPTQLKKLTQQFAESANGKDLLHHGKLIDVSDWKHSLIVAPIMIAFDVAQGKAEAWNKDLDLLNALRQYRDFDRIWFDDAYKVGMACAYNKGLINT